MSSANNSIIRGLPSLISTIVVGSKLNLLNTLQKETIDSRKLRQFSRQVLLLRKESAAEMSEVFL